MHEGLKNGKNDYKWRFVLNRWEESVLLASAAVVWYNVSRVVFDMRITAFERNRRMEA